jgi:hypothetical protein
MGNKSSIWNKHLIIIETNIQIFDISTKKSETILNATNLNLKEKKN